MEINEMTKGWKGYLGAGILLAVGFYLLLTGEKVAGVQAIGTGLGLLGIRHRLSYQKK